ncbi:hypothetical protein [Capnocytophaga canimorsus]|uniref:hypothetical protein n=1 Tax=Capnocytophaga canimorsus TaxID=28188 RepID=UPI001EE12087|nr:hypothetical protein [Capnocytophaga canimorsus]GJQ03617.1 hypothetical protein CAPN009_00320 [Capnocytophaga canimorsus]
MQSFRTKVFKTAYKILKNFKDSITFGEALRTAWHLYRTEKERAKYIVKTEATPERIEQIARNINAFDTMYNYIDGYDNRNKWQFWNDLRKKLENILERLTDNAKAQIKVLCEPQQAEYFGL